MSMIQAGGPSPHPVFISSLTPTVSFPLLAQDWSKKYTISKEKFCSHLFQ